MTAPGTTTPKTCLHCATPLIRKSDENLWKFERRQYCDIACSMASRKRSFQAKNCKSCGTLLVRRAKEAGHKFERRQHCNSACRGKWQTFEAEKRLASDTKLCPCGATITRKPNRSVSDFEKRKYCSLTCSSRRETLTERHAKRRTARQIATSQSWGRNGSHHKKPRVFIQPPKPGTPFEDPLRWLETHEATKCPTKFCAPITGAGS